MKHKIEAMYLDYFNNFLTIPFFAAYYGLDENKAGRVIEIGRKLNDRRSNG